MTSQSFHFKPGMVFGSTELVKKITNRKWVGLCLSCGRQRTVGPTTLKWMVSRGSRGVCIFCAWVPRLSLKIGFSVGELTILDVDRSNKKNPRMLMKCSRCGIDSWHWGSRLSELKNDYVQGKTVACQKCLKAEFVPKERLCNICGTTDRNRFKPSMASRCERCDRAFHRFKQGLMLKEQSGKGRWSHE